MRYLLFAAIAVIAPLRVLADDAHWQRTTNDRCLVWDALPQPDETVTWSGACIDGKASGHGSEVFRYRAGGVWKEERYVGEMQGGKLHGRGTLDYDNGDRYEGLYADGMRVGRGTYTHANGDRYEGEYRDDKIMGRGTFTYHNGGRYEGDFRDGMPNGYGTFRDGTGEILTGNWSKGCLRQGDRVAAAGTTKEKCGFK